LCDATVAQVIFKPTAFLRTFAIQPEAMTTKIESEIISTTESSKLTGQCFGIVQDLEDKLPERWWETLFDEM